MNIINEFNSFFNNLYSYRLPIILTLVLVVSLLLLIVQTYLRLETDFKEIVMLIILIIFLIENILIIKLLINNKIQISDIMFGLLQYIILVIVSEGIRFLEFFISKRCIKHIYKVKDGMYSYGLFHIEIEATSDNRYITKDIKTIVLHCKNGEAECKLISKQEFENIEYGEKINFKIISKVKYAFFD
ncbi:hypothetical protein [Clostridium paraputrificum]|uniref:hypothetical protein n=1 Tax=Clostridium paraputrificum TaxID=29363 RepID=UPI0004233018|nr:hypothetical protein [Clostridium paraputrificum]